MGARVGDWVEALEARYPREWAEEWDAVGLVTGDPDAPAEKAHFAIDPTEETLDEALAAGATLLVTHHPLLLKGVHGVPMTSAKGRLVSRLVEHKVALYVAHTNADVANPGVSDALASALGLALARPLAPADPDAALKLVTFVPGEAVGRVVDALDAVGAGAIGGYTRCAFTTEGTGTFVAGEGTSPTVGRTGELTSTPETRVEMVVPIELAQRAVAALRAAHPYEEPAYDLYPLLLTNSRGTGRVAELPAPVTLRLFVATVAEALPGTAAGVRVAGDLDRPVQRVAVCGGAGDSYVDNALAAGADVYVTADLRHHPVREGVERGLALIDAGHWASEWPWLRRAADETTSALSAAGHTVAVTVSDLVTDPWTGSQPGRQPA